MSSCWTPGAAAAKRQPCSERSLQRHDGNINKATAAVKLAQTRWIRERLSMLVGTIIR